MPSKDSLIPAESHRNAHFLQENKSILTAKFRLKLKKVGNTTGPFRYELNQIPYNYTVEMTNRFNGLDQADQMPKELWIEVHDIIWEVIIKIIPKKK